MVTLLNVKYISKLGKAMAKLKNDLNLQDDIAFIKNNVAPNATNEELKMLLYLSKEYNLDPLKKEIYLIKYSGKSTIITSRDGYLKIANANPDFDGLESDVVYLGDTLIKRDDGSIHITYGQDHLQFDKTKLTGAYCSVFRKDRSKAITVFVSLKDYYKKGTPIWEQYINAMILKVAEAMALKRAFSISGLVTREEIEGKEFEVETEQSYQEDSSATESQRKALFLAAHAKNITDDILKDMLLKNFNKLATKELSKDEANLLITQLNALP